jgi:hypothetical protein
VRSPGRSRSRRGSTPIESGRDYADGVLTLHVPKPAEVKPRKVAIRGGKNQETLES